MRRVTISEEDFQLFRELFYRRTGIWFDDNKRYFVDRRLEERIQACGLDNFRAYYLKLRSASDGEEWQRLINCMTVNETYFFREAHQLECLVNSMLEEVTRRDRGSRPIRIWCIPCSTGEEPYSVAIYLLERWPKLAVYDVEIYGSDIDTAVLERAREGRYSGRSLQYVPEEYLRRYFRRVGPDEYVVADVVRNAVGFSRANLVEPREGGFWYDCDVIFCRNLLIYFDDVARRRAAESLYEALAPGGFLCLGHAESMSRVSGMFVPRRFPEGVVYQKVEEE